MSVALVAWRRVRGRVGSHWRFGRGVFCESRVWSVRNILCCWMMMCVFLIDV